MVRAIGMPVADAQKLAQSYGVTASDVDADNPPARTIELVVDCVTLWVRAGSVAKASIG